MNMSKIFHYTTIDTLALIMLNKTIRFNRLDNVDDTDESKYGSGPYNTILNKYVFVSCWTKNPAENIDLWKRYANEGKGIRIAMDEDMFVSYQNYSVLGSKFKSYFPNKFYVTGDCLFVDVNNEIMLYDVEYVENVEMHTKKLIEQNRDYINYYIPKVGIYKNRDKWEQQGESRFRIFAFPLTIKDAKNLNMENVNDVFKAFDIGQYLLTNNHPINLTHYDMSIKKEAIDSIEIMMGPNTTAEDKAKVQRILYPCYINRFFSKRKITDSSIKITK